MNMTKPTLSLLFLALFSSSSIANEFKILDYHNGIKTDRLPCKMEAIDNWFTGDQYMCRFDNSATDVVEFQSDFISQEIYQIDRYILLDISDAKTVTKKIIEKYGKPNSTVLDNSFSTPLPMSVWGGSKIESLYEFSHSITHPQKESVGLSMQFLKCSGISLGKCRSIFNIAINAPNKTVLNLSIFDAARYAYSKTVMETGKAPETEKTIDKNTSGINNLRF
jgi:hypothetical protein